MVLLAQRRRITHTANSIKSIRRRLPSRVTRSLSFRRPPAAGKRVQRARLLGGGALEFLEHWTASGVAQKDGKGDGWLLLPNATCGKEARFYSMFSISSTVQNAARQASRRVVLWEFAKGGQSRLQRWRWRRGKSASQAADRPLAPAEVAAKGCQQFCNCLLLIDSVAEHKCGPAQELWVDVVV